MLRPMPPYPSRQTMVLHVSENGTYIEVGQDWCPISFGARFQFVPYFNAALFALINGTYIEVGEDWCPISFGSMPPYVH